MEVAALKNLPSDSAFRGLSLWLDLLISVKDVSLFNFPSKYARRRRHSRKQHRSVRGELEKA